MRPILLPALIALLLPTLAHAEAPVSIFRDGERILFQGDSITDGGRGRTADPNHILGHSYPFLIAARHAAAFPERGLTFLNRGISGNQVTHLADRWQADAIDVAPTTLSVLVGVNDVVVNLKQGRPVDVANYERTYDKLLTDLAAARPGLRIILIDPFVFPGRSTDALIDRAGPLVAQMRDVVARLATKYHAPVVHAQAIFEAAAKRAPIDYWIWDGVHPTFAGQQLIADEWQRVYADAYGPPPATTRPSPHEAR